MIKPMNALIANIVQEVNSVPKLEDISEATHHRKTIGKNIGKS
jgi:hypothetical protein